MTTAAGFPGGGGYRAVPRRGRDRDVRPARDGLGQSDIPAGVDGAGLEDFDTQSGSMNEPAARQAGRQVGRGGRVP